MSLLQDFSQFDLDSRIIKSINQKLQFSKPTLIQETLIPFALKGQNILGKSKTGSGKTAAYCIPLVQKILSKVRACLSLCVFFVPSACASLKIRRHSL